MSATIAQDIAIAEAEVIDAKQYVLESRRHSAAVVDEKLASYDKKEPVVAQEAVTYTDPDYPSEEEQASLRRVPDKIPLMAYTIALVECCERFSFYGTTQVFSAFLQFTMPPNSKTGSYAHLPDWTHGGAFGLGQTKKSAIINFWQFWCYVTPIIGAWIADTYWGRYKTIMWAIALAMFGHVLLIVSAVPGVIENENNKGLAIFMVALLWMGAGTGGFKSNISPLIADQVSGRKMYVRVLKDGERVIVDPFLTISRLYMYFYLMINVGAMIGQIGMVYAEKYVGFWLSFTLPTIMFILCPAVLAFCRKRYKSKPAEGSVLSTALRLLFRATKGRWSINPLRTHRNMHDGTFWDSVKPSRIPANQRPKWMTFDDAWVDQVARGFKACSVFVFFPLYWLTYNQINGNLTSQAQTMNTHGLPGDVLTNLNSLAIIIFIPLFDLGLYPFLRKRGIRFTALKKVLFGFLTGSLAMLWALVLQWFIYKKSPCGYNATNCSDKGTIADINVWWQTGSLVLISVSEVFASITGLEYAYTKAPANMKSLVMSMFLFTSAVATAIGQGLNFLVADPLLLWNYGVAGVLSTLGAIGFWWAFHDLDKQEDALNNLQEAKFDKAEVPSQEPESGRA